VERERIFADFTLLRSKQMVDLTDQAWMDLQDRRWHQYCEAGFSFTPQDQLWAAYFKCRMKKETLLFHTLIPAYTRLAVETTKQKLRELAEKATKADKVGSLVGVWFCSLVGWCVVRLLGLCFVLLPLTTHARSCTHARKPRGKRQATSKE